MPINETLIRLVLAALLGAGVGWERQRADKPIGIRTLALVSMGAALFTLIGILFTDEIHGPSRMAANVITGLGFLGAGVIFSTGSEPRGLTTAALIWFTGAVGIAVGAGFWELGLAGAVLAVLFLRLRT
ncbi:MgtC/SapB family protein [bacterium]|nr:MgtC/SapB family protein [bacterium]